MLTDSPNQSKNNSLTETKHSTSPDALDTNETFSSSNSPDLKVIKRNGKLDYYDDNKIKVAITKAFLAVEGGTAASSTRIHETVDQLTQNVTEHFQKKPNSSTSIHIEEIQDRVEIELMQQGLHKVARAYVLYREERHKARLAKQAATERTEITILDKNGNKTNLSIDYFNNIAQEACQNLEDVSPKSIISQTLRNLFDGATMADVNKALTLSARTLIEKEPNYTFVAARLLLDALRAEALQFLKIGDSATFQKMSELYPHYFECFVHKGIELKMLDPKLADYDLKVLGEALVPQRDLNFTYLGIQTLYDRYFIHFHGTRYELPQALFMRVAMGLALNEPEREKRAIEFYNLLSTFSFMSATPTLFNSGTCRPQLSSCFLTTVPDDLEGIYNAIKDNALLSKFAGGLGNDWTSVRAIGSHIKGTNGKSLGVVPFMNVANATAIAVNQGGKRKGAVCGYLETWHLDIEEFLELRKNTGDERRRTHDMNTANWIPDLFMKRLFENGQWTLFSPDEVPNLHDLYGEAFEKAYVQYEKAADEGKITNYKRIPAFSLWRKMLTMLFETGHPWITFKDACNLRSPQQHVGVIHSSNLCTEITLNTSKDEVAVCNLGSINLPLHISNNRLDIQKLQNTINTAIRMLDNVIDINYYTIPQARNSNLKHRPIGLGIMGFQDALHILGHSYESQEALSFADTSMEYISYYAFKSSCELAKERGAYPTYKGSLWDKGILPIDSIKLLKENRQQYLDQDTNSLLLKEWGDLREQIKKYGMRNSNVLAIAPTATISNICGVSQSIEPTYQNLFVKSNLSGEFTVVNSYLAKELKKLNLWDDVMVNDLKYYDGSISKIDRIPQHLKKKYATAFEIDPLCLIEAASRRQKWIDQGQSLNLYIAEPSGKKLDNIYKTAWLKGLKTTYYARTLGATSSEKSTITDGALNAVSVSSSPTSCSLDAESCEVCQ